MNIPFKTFFQRLRQVSPVTNQSDLAEAIGVHRSAITQAKNRDSVPQKWVLILSRRYSLSPDWLEFGKGEPRATGKDDRPRVLHPDFDDAIPCPDEELIYVPKAAAKLCAGGGSFEVEARTLAEYPLPYCRLAALGSPPSMIFMDVSGDSMEPGIRDGDMVLVDQSRTEIGKNGILAVGLEEAIYLKRVLRSPAGLILRSDNERYADISIAGDELLNFRVIGKVVWLCRDCRFD